MFRLMQRFSFAFVFYVLVWIPVYILAVVLPGRPLDSGMVFFEGVWVILILLGSVITCEQTEGKTNGYKFLQTLPVKDSLIVGSKFFLVVISAVCVVAYINIIYLFVEIPSDVNIFARIFIPFCAAVGVLIDGILYALIFKIGLTKTIKIGWIVFFGYVVGTILFIEFVLVKSDIDSEKVSGFLHSIPVWIWIGIGLAVLAVDLGLMILAIKLKIKNRR